MTMESLECAISLIVGDALQVYMLLFFGLIVGVRLKKRCGHYTVHCES